MSFQPVVVIPLYNHDKTIGKLVKAIRALELPVIIVDDGSDAATKAVLGDLRRDIQQLTIVELAENSGKGAAVMRGAREAGKRGFSHILQIDADGQHNVQDLPRFLEAGSAHPECLILGEPLFEASVPKSRLWGRLLTTVWVRINTLSLEIKDAMCGFRLYPLPPFLRLIDGRRMGQRMDFDIEIVVRLVWQGLRPITLPTRVSYPQDGISHFRLFLDNVLISWVHARLFFGMMARLPWLIIRKFRKAARPASPPIKPSWYEVEERGSMWGLKFMFFAYRSIGSTICALLLYPVVTYFFLTAAKTRRVSLDYLRQLQAFNLKRGLPGMKVRWTTSLRHFLEFGRSALDKISVWMGDIDPYSVVWEDESAIRRLLAEKNGALLVSAHLGNIEIARSLCERKHGMVVNALMDLRNARRFNAILSQTAAQSLFRVIPLEVLTPHSVQDFKARLERGEYFAVLGDRLTEGTPGRAVRTSFLDREATFPIGPFALAALLECPVYLVFSLRRRGHYHLYCEYFAERLELGREREKALQAYVDRFAQRLEICCQQAPLQWFNFYDFWNTTSAPGRPKTAHENRPKPTLGAEIDDNAAARTAASR